MKGCYNKLLSLHEQTLNDYNVKKLEHTEMQIELSQHQEQSRDIYGNCSAEAPGVQQYLFQDELRARLTEHLPDMTMEPHRPMGKRFVQGWTTGVVQDHWTA